MLPSREHTIRLTIRNDLADLALVRDALEKFGVEHDFARESLVQLQVALDEIVSNVIKYAWPQGGRHELSVQMAARPDVVEVEIVDNGKAFDPLSAAPPEPPSPGSRPVPGGVGIHMVRRLVDGMEYARIAGCNHIKLTKRYAAGGSPEREHDDQ